MQAADAQQWLKAACRMATEGPLASSAADFACAREQAFPSTEGNAYRQLRVSDFSDTVAALPPEELQVLFPHHRVPPLLGRLIGRCEVLSTASQVFVGIVCICIVLGAGALLSEYICRALHCMLNEKKTGGVTGVIGMFLQAAVLGGARGGPAGQAGQPIEVGWEEVLDQLPQEAAAELRNAGRGESA